MNPPPPARRPNGWSLLPRWARRASLAFVVALLALAFTFPVFAFLPPRIPAAIEAVHHFLLFAAAVLLAVFAFWATVLDSRGKRRRRTGRCPRCNYDCRATPNPAGPTLPTCPECGQGL